MIFNDEQEQYAREWGADKLAIAKPTGFEQNVVAQFESYMTLDALGAERKSERDLYDQRLATIANLTGQKLKDPFSPIPSFLQPERDRKDPATWTPLDKEQNMLQDPIALAFTLFAGREGGNEYERLRTHEEEVERIRMTLPPRDRHLIPTKAEIEGMVKDRAQLVERTANDVGSRADLAGLAGGFVGSAGAAMTTPEQLITLPIGAPAKVGLLARVLIEAGIGMGTEAVLQPAVQDQRVDLGVQNGLGPALENIATAGAGAGIFALGGEALRAVLKGGVTAFRKLAGREPTPDEAAAIDVAQAATDSERVTPYEQRTAAASAVHQANDEAATMAALDGRAIEEQELADDRELVRRALTQGSNFRVYTNADINEIGVDAELMQFKAGGDESGVTDRLRGIKKWETERAGQTMLYEFLDGRVIVADGHQRLALAKRLAAEGQEIELPAYTLREADGVTPGQARARAAFKNMGEGTGTPTDAAKVMRETGATAEQMNLPPKSALVRDAEGLQNLNDDVFGMVINDVIDERMAAIIGREVENGPLQTNLAQLLIRLAPANATEAESIIAQARHAGVERSTQTSLFGEEDIAESLYLERARVLDRAVKMVRRNTATFRTLLDQEGSIAAAGNVLDQASNAARLDSDRRLLQYVQTLANRKGPISDALTEAARSAKATGNYQGPARQFVEALNSGAGPGALDGAPGRADGGAAESHGEDTQAQAAGTRSGAEQVVPDEDTLAMFDEPVGPKVDKLTDRLSREINDQVGEEEAAAAANLRKLPETSGQPPDAAPGKPLQLEAIGDKPARITTLDAFKESAPSTMDELYAGAPAAQAQLVDVGQALASSQGIEFRDGGVKKRATSEEKMGRKAYRDTRQLTDVARGGFVVDTPDQADAIMAAYSEKFAVIDEGWARTPEGYFDRKLLVKFDSGVIGEVQLWNRRLLEAKEAGGHSLYTRARSLPDDSPEYLQLREQMRQLYFAASEAADASWSDVVNGLGKGGASGNSAANAAGVTSRPELATSSNLTGTQAPPGSTTANAEGPTSTAGRPSQSTNSGMENPSVPDIGTSPQRVNDDGLLPGFAPITDKERMDMAAGRGLDGSTAAPLEVGLFNDMLRGQTDLLDIPIPVGERIDANGKRVADTMTARQILDDLEEEQDFMDQLNQCDLLAAAE